MPRCIVGHEPREFDATRGLVLSNLSEMLVRQLERKWAESEALQSNVQLMRSLACYEEAFLFLDTSREGDWRVLHMNMAASTALGGYLPAPLGCSSSVESWSLEQRLGGTCLLSWLFIVS